MAIALPRTAPIRAAMLAVLTFFTLTAAAAGQPLGVPQQVSFTEPLDYAGTDSTNSAVAYGGGRSLVVWEAEEVTEDRTFSTRSVIMGRFVDGTATPLASSFVISDSEQFNVRDIRPDVAYDASRNQFVVVWESSDVGDARGLNGVIRGALVTPQAAVTPSKVLTPEDIGFRDPAVAYNAATDEYLLAFHDNSSTVFIRKLDAGDLNLDGTAQDISSGFGFEEKNDALPDVAWDPVSGRWLVVWQAGFGFGSKGPFRGPAPIDPTVEIYGRSFDAALNGSDLERISHEFGNPGFDFEIGAREPAVSPDTKGGGFLVVYVGVPGPDEETQERGNGFVEEIFSRRVNGDGTVAGDAIQVSDSAADGDQQEIERPARRPDVWHDGNADQFLVSWAQDVTERDPGREDAAIEYELFGKKVDGNGSPIEGDTRISDHAPSEDSQFDGDLPAVTYDASTCDYIVSWTGEEFAEGSDEKEEVWDRAYDAPPCPAGTADRAAAVVTPSGLSRRCGSRRNFPIHLVRRSDREYIFALVKVNGQEVNVTYGNRVEAIVNLVGLPLGRFTVDIEARLENGKVLKGARRYFTCNKKLPPSNGLEREDAL